MADDIELRIGVDDSGVEQSLQKTRDGFRRLGRSIGRTFNPRRLLGGITRSVFSLRTAFAGLVGLFAGRAILQAAARQEDAVNALNQSLRSAGTFSQEASQRIQEFAAGLQQVTTFGDEAVLEMVSLAQSFVRTAEEAQELTAAALDFSVGAGITFEEAVRRLGRGVQGASGDIANFAPEIRQLTKDQLAAGEATRILADRFRGAAAAQLQTFSGATRQLNNNFTTLLESIGKLVTQNPAFVKVVNLLSKLFTRLSDFVNKNAGILREQLLRALIFVADGIILVVSNLDVLINSFRNVQIGINNFLGTIVETRIQLNELIKSAKESSFGRFLGADAKATATDLKELRQISAEIIKENISLEKQNMAVSGSFDPLREKLIQIRAELAAVGETSRKELGKSTENTEEQGKKMSAAAQAAADSINQAYQQGILRVITTSIAKIGESLAKGALSFKDFGRLILGIIGDIAINIGSTLIGIGLGIEALKTALATLSGGVAIAAGIALVALGGLLKGLGTGGIGSAAPSEPVGAGGGTPGLPEEPETETTRGTEVIVNIEGNVLDRRETGLAIAEAINEAFDKEGALIARGAIA